MLVAGYAVAVLVGARTCGPLARLLALCLAMVCIDGWVATRVALGRVVGPVNVVRDWIGNSDQWGVLMWVVLLGQGFAFALEGYPDAGAVLVLVGLPPLVAAVGRALVQAS